MSYKEWVTSCIPAVTEGWTKQVLWLARVMQLNKMSLTSKNEKYFEKLIEEITSWNSYTVCLTSNISCQCNQEELQKQYWTFSSTATILNACIKTPLLDLLWNILPNHLKSTLSLTADSTWSGLSLGKKNQFPSFLSVHVLPPKLYEITKSNLYSACLVLILGNTCLPRLMFIIRNVAWDILLSEKEKPYLSSTIFRSTQLQTTLTSIQESSSQDSCISLWRLIRRLWAPSLTPLLPYPPALQGFQSNFDDYQV